MMTDKEILAAISNMEGATPEDVGVSRERLDLLTAAGLLRCTEDMAFPEQSNPFYEVVA